MVRHCLGTLISERVGVLLSFEPNDLVMRKRGSTLLESLLIQCPVAWRCWYVFYFMSDSSQQFRRNAIAILGSRMIAIPGNPKKWMTRTHINSQYPSRDLWQHPNTLLVGGLEHLDNIVPSFLWVVILPIFPNSMIFQRGRSTTNQTLLIND